MRFSALFAATVILAVPQLARVAVAASLTGGQSAEVRIGERLFSDPRFSQCFVRNPLPVPPRSTGYPDAMSCARCHIPPQTHTEGESICGFCDRAARSTVPARDDGRTTTPRNSPSLVGALTPASEASLLHFDGEFASADDLVRETFLGRNYGWLPGERAQARHHFASVVRSDRGGAEAGADDPARYSYAMLLMGSDTALPGTLQLPRDERIDVSRASDEEILAHCAHLVAAYVRSLQFPRDAEGYCAGTAYDALLTRLPQLARRGNARC